MAAPTRVMKEIHSLLRKANKLFNGQVRILLEADCDDRCKRVDVAENDEGTMVSFSMHITPNDGLYKNATCKFVVLVDTSTYPGYAPIVQCLTNVYHPNIDTTSLEYLRYDETNICVSLLEEDWSPEAGLEGCVLATLFLFYHPQIDDALSPVCCDFEDWEDFENEVRKSLRGKEVKDGHTFEKLLEGDDNGNDAKEEKNVEERNVVTEADAKECPPGGTRNEECDETETNTRSDTEEEKEDMPATETGEVMTGDLFCGDESDALETSVANEGKVFIEKNKASTNGYYIKGGLALAAVLRPWVKKLKEGFTFMFFRASRIKR